jgi:hypothetical protein
MMSQTRQYLLFALILIAALGAAREKYLMSRTRKYLLFALILIAALLSAVLRLVQLVPVAKRPKRQEGKTK